MDRLDTPTLTDVRLDLACHLLALAERLDLYFRLGSGAAFLGFPDTDGWRAVPDLNPTTLNVERFPAGVELEDVFRYAVYGELTASWIDDDEETGNLGALRAVIRRTEALDRCDEEYDVIVSEFGVKRCLADVVELAEARLELDNEEHLSLQNLGRLARVDLRRVRNALSASGDDGLRAERGPDGEQRVPRSEALRWLGQTRAFAGETVRVGAPIGGVLAPPAELAPEQVVPFLFKRARGLGGYDDADFLRWQERIARRALFWPTARLAEVLTGTGEPLTANEAHALARVLYLDSGWLAKQLGLAAPKRRQDLPNLPPPSPYDADSKTLEVVLTEAGVKHGYFDIEMRWALQLFPRDAFGDRDGKEKGENVELSFGGTTANSDIRIKSKNVASPRRRFHGFFGQCRARAGDRVRITLTAERAYRLEILPQSGGNHAAR